jgi:hypothetical protein
MMDKKLRDFLEAVAKLEQDRETMCVNAIALMCILSAAQLEGKGRVDKHDLAKWAGQAIRSWPFWERDWDGIVASLQKLAKKEAN